jgi:archaellum biogenesis protein FlaJ (TadC family)
MKTDSNLSFCRDIALVVAGICLATAITTIANVYFPTEPAVYDYFSKPKLVGSRDLACFIAELLVALVPHLVLVFLFRKFNRLFFVTYVVTAILSTAPFVYLSYIALTGFGGPHPGP